MKATNPSGQACRTGTALHNICQAASKQQLAGNTDCTGSSCKVRHRPAACNMAEGRLDQQTDSPAMYSVYEMRVWRRRIQPNKWAAVALDVISTTSWFFTNLHPTMDSYKTHKWLGRLSQFAEQCWKAQPAYRQQGACCTPQVAEQWHCHGHAHPSPGLRSDARTTAAAACAGYHRGQSRNLACRS